MKTYWIDALVDGRTYTSDWHAKNEQQARALAVAYYKQKSLDVEIIKITKK